jgi:hypothetical protein
VIVGAPLTIISDLFHLKFAEGKREGKCCAVVVDLGEIA